MRKFPIIQRLLHFQIAAASFGLILFLFLGYSNYRVQRDAYVRELNASIRPVLEKHLEQWIAWKELNLTRALEEDFKRIGSSYPIERLEIIKDPVSQELTSSGVLIYPETSIAAPLGYRAAAKIRSPYSKSSSIDSTFFYFIVSGFFCVMVLIVLSGRAIKRHTSGLLSVLGEGLIQLEHGGKPFQNTSPSYGEVQDILDLVNRLHLRSKEIQKEVAVGQIAAQVAHDIISPVASLGLIEPHLGALNDDVRAVVRGSIAQIREIAKNLLLQSKPMNSSIFKECNSSLALEGRSTEHISSVLSHSLGEKRFQNSGNLKIQFEENIGPDSYEAFVRVQPIEFKRVLSNLLNNAIESLSGAGRVTVELKLETPFVVFSVSDSGKGIPPQLISRLGTRGATFGKEGGSGLGLFHAKKSVEDWGGELKISSTVGRGTVVRVLLPLAPTPSSFVKEIKLFPEMDVVILDDNSLIHEMWKARFKNLISKPQGIRLHHFMSPVDFSQWVRQSPDSPFAFYLVDYELNGVEESGLEVIQKLNLHAQSILVTGLTDDDSIHNTCSRTGIPLLSKTMAAFIPLTVAPS